jgi:Family of unknown function (DUF6166)
MKTYHGLRTDSGCIVSVKDDDNDYLLPWRCDLFNHSPTGLEWGYGGSGPAQLALAILADTLRDKMAEHSNTAMARRAADRVAVQLHQDFKWAYIAKLKRNEQWTITQQQVLDFIAASRRKEAL